MRIRHLAIIPIAICAVLFSLLGTEANAQDLEDLIFVEGRYENPMYTSSPTQTLACTFFSGNVGRCGSRELGPCHAGNPSEYAQ